MIVYLSYLLLTVYLLLIVNVCLLCVQNFSRVLALVLLLPFLRLVLLLLR